MKKSAVLILVFSFFTMVFGVLYNSCSEKDVDISSTSSGSAILPGGGVINKITIKGTDITLQGDKLNNITGVSLNGNSLNLTLNVLQEATGFVVARAASTINLKFGLIYNLVLTQAGAQSSTPIQAVVNPGSCAVDEVMQGFNSDGTLNCKKINQVIINLAAPVRYAITNNTFKTPVPYKLCIMTRHYVGIGGVCELTRNADSTWQLVCQGVTQTLTVTNPNGGYPINYSADNGGSSDGAIYCYN